jgi:hypothetical protein
MKKTKNIIRIYDKSEMADIVEMEIGYAPNLKDFIIFKHKALEYTAKVNSRTYNIEEDTLYITAACKLTDYDYMAMAEYERWMEKD